MIKNVLNSKKKQILTNKKIRLLLGIILSILAFYFIPVEDTTPSISEPATEEATASDIADLRVHFIDVGQGDSILIESNDHAMLIDAGENDQGKVVVNYLNSLGIKRLDYLIGTHPHSDHIGGLDDVIRNFDIDKVIMPDVVHTTKTFEDVIDAIAEKNLKITRAVSGNQYQLGSASFDIIAPNSSSYNNLNDYSVVIKLKNGDHSFLFTGDAEKTSENEMLQSGKDLSADVLKLGHHGSSTSNQGKFLDAVSPSYAVITLAKDNKYGHPHKEVISELSKRNISVLRTDEQGTIIIHSDGQKLDMNNKPISISKQTTQPKEEKDTNNQRRR